MHLLSRFVLLKSSLCVTSPSVGLRGSRGCRSNGFGVDSRHDRVARRHAMSEPGGLRTFTAQVRLPGQAMPSSGGDVDADAAIKT